MKLPLLWLVLATASSASLAPPETILTVSGPETTLRLTAADLKALPHTQITATDPHEKGTHTYSGVPVGDLLAKVGAPLGDKLRGKDLRLAVLVHSSDGYSILYALAEFDPLFSDRTLLLADSVDGGPLAPNAGPLRIVAPGDKRAARWARMVTSIEVVQPGATP